MANKIKAISFEWDSGNITKSWIKHGIRKEECEEVFLNRPLKIFDDNKHSSIESRYLAYGKTSSDLYLIIVFTLRNHNIRVISARRQSKKEREIYEQK